MSSGTTALRSCRQARATFPAAVASPTPTGKAVSRLPRRSPAVEVVLQVASQVLPKGPRLGQGGHVVAVAIHRQASGVAAQLTQRALHLIARPPCSTRAGRRVGCHTRPGALQTTALAQSRSSTVDNHTMHDQLTATATGHTYPRSHRARAPWRPAAPVARRCACQCRCRVEGVRGGRMPAETRCPHAVAERSGEDH